MPLKAKGLSGLAAAARAGAGAVLALAWAMAALPAFAVSLDDLLKPPAYAGVTISPDGKYLAANAPLDDRTALVVIRVSDLKPSAMIDPGKDTFVDSTAWISDTHLLSAVSTRVGRREEPYSIGSLFSVNANGGDRRFFGGNVLDTLVDDPDYVLVQRCRKPLMHGCLTEVVRMRIDGMKREDVVTAPIANATFFTDRQHQVRLSWSSDDEDVQKLYLLNGGDWSLVNDEATSGIEAYPVGVSADNAAVYLVAERKAGPDVIERMDLATGKRVVVAEDKVLDPGGLVWSFDRKEPIGVRYGHDAQGIRFFDESHPHVQLMRDLGKSFPGEIASIVSSTRNGDKSVVWVGSDRDPGRYYLMDTASGELSLLAKTKPWLEPGHLAASREISFEARDGVPLQGYLTLPQRVANPPLVVMPHGGPFGVKDEWTFDTETQILAAQGYAVLRVNFRGSSGRGRGFIESGYRQWGRAMQDDLTDATRWAMREAGVDPARICIWGASYGGYAALMGVIREPDLYRCAIGVSGPYDLPTMYKWGDIQRSRWGRARLQLSLGDDQQALLDNSPTQHAGEIKAAVMLVQGGRDPRVSPEHVKLMRRALDKAGKAYETYLPLQETHGFYGNESRKEYYLRVLRFLDTHLKQ